MINRSNRERLASIGLRRSLADLSRRALDANAAKAGFLVEASNELRGPARSLAGMAELLAMTDLDSRQRTFVDVLSRSAGALTSIIDDVLMFSRLEGGSVQMEPAPFLLTGLVEEVASDCNRK